MGLGNHVGVNNSNRQPPTDEDRLRLLKGYRKAMVARTDWGDIDRRFIKRVVDDEISRLVFEVGVQV
jgi:hypothetical protein